jgi:hypothetical protein
MTLPVNEPNGELAVIAKSASVGASPAVAYAVAPVKGRIVRTYFVCEGAASGTIAVAVAINGGSDIGTGALSVAGGAGNAASDTPSSSGGTSYVNEGDVIAFTPSGGSGSNIPGQFTAVIRK